MELADIERRIARLERAVEILLKRYEQQDADDAGYADGMIRERDAAIALRAKLAARHVES